MSHSSASQAAFINHALRARVLAEVHARPFVPIETPRRLLHFAFMTDALAAARDRQALEAFCVERAAPVPAPEARYHRIVLSPATLRWERHGEFTTYTWDFPAVPGEMVTPFKPSVDELAGIMHLVPQPGPLIVAVDLHLVSGGDLDGTHRLFFGPAPLSASEVERGRAVVMTDFHPDAFGFVRVLVLNRKLLPSQIGTLVQRTLEIETYRTLALLGLPEAQQLGPSLRHGETELPRLLQQMRESHGFDANRDLLDHLTALAAELEGSAAQSAYRFGATRAYFELLNLRLASIGEAPCSDLSTLGAFLGRRLAPAIRTCTATEARQEQLSQKLARVAELLRTRVDVELESQNSSLLRSMNERARVQLRLQQTVEGLSVAAITYYVASILHTVFEGVHTRVTDLQPEVATAVAVPLILIFVGWTVHRIRKGHHVP